MPSSIIRESKLQSARAFTAWNESKIGRSQGPVLLRMSSSYILADVTRKHSTSQSPPFFSGVTTAVALGITVVTFDPTVQTSRSRCDAPPDSVEKESFAAISAAANSATGEKSPLLTTKPLWPGGVSEEDVDALVEIIMEDPNINIPMVPDAVEAIIYKSAVKLTLNLFYSLLGDVNGTPLLSHQIHVSRLVEEEEDREEDKKSSWFNGLFGSEQKSTASKKKRQYRRIAGAATVNDELLDKVAERLLQNQAVNSKYIPDQVELYIYQSCLKVVFRTLEILSHTFRINLCGHDISISIEPSKFQQTALTAASNLYGGSQQQMNSEIDMRILEEFAFKAGADGESYLNDGNLSFWDHFWLRRRRKMIAKLHASLYGLILGIVDDILQHSSVKILSDDIFLDITPGDAFSGNDAKAARPADSEHTGDAASKNTSTVKKSSSKFPFIAGMGVGAGLMFLVSSKR